MSRRESIIPKIRALLRLSKSPNPHEAAVALAKAQELLLRHSLSVAEVGEDRPGGSGAQVIRQNIGSQFNWKRRLARTVAIHNGCDCVVSGTELLWVGRPEAVAVVQEMFNWVLDQCEQWVRFDSALRPPGLSPAKFRTSYMEGATLEIGRRLAANRVKLVATVRGSSALVVRSEAEVREALQKLFPAGLRVRTAQSITANKLAYQLGAGRGREVNLTPPSRTVSGFEQG